MQPVCWRCAADPAQLLQILKGTDFIAACLHADRCRQPGLTWLESQVGKLRLYEFMTATCLSGAVGYPSLTPCRPTPITNQLFTSRNAAHTDCRTGSVQQRYRSAAACADLQLLCDESEVPGCDAACLLQVKECEGALHLVLRAALQQL
jgi:hypothetical protein